MARYKYIDTNPRLLPVNLAAQVLPGTFEHAVDHLLEHAVDLSAFDARFRNDTTGATAYPPALLLKVVLCAYAHGIVSSRAIAWACEEHVTFVALCGARTPHFTTIAHFVSTPGAEIAAVFGAVLAVCDQQGLIGREWFAIDGVKLPSNASKRRSGTRADFERQATKLETAAQAMLTQHQAQDAAEAGPPPDGPGTPRTREKARLARLERDAAQLRAWLAAHPHDRRGPSGAVRLSNRTDAESATMATSKGVIQGFTAVATGDAAHQIVIDAQVHGTGSEQELLVPVLDAITPQCTSETVPITDAGYHSEANLQAPAEPTRPALIADRDLPARDERFATQGATRHARGPGAVRPPPFRRPARISRPNSAPSTPSGASTTRSGRTRNSTAKRRPSTANRLRALSPLGSRPRSTRDTFSSRRSRRMARFASNPHCSMWRTPSPITTSGWKRRTIASGRSSSTPCCSPSSTTRPHPRRLRGNDTSPICYSCSRSHLLPMFPVAQP